MDCGEQALLPAVRQADPATLIVANRFSCETQVEQAGTGRLALHLGEVIRLAQSAQTTAGREEEPVTEDRPAPSRAARVGPRRGRARHRRARRSCSGAATR